MTSPQAKLNLFNLARERSCIILSSLHKSFDTTTMVSLRLWMPWKSWFSVLMFILLYFYRSGKHKHDKRLFSREGVAQCVCCINCRILWNRFGRCDVALHEKQMNQKSNNYWELKEKGTTTQISAPGSFRDGVNYINNRILSFSIHAASVSN